MLNLRNNLEMRFQADKERGSAVVVAPPGAPVTPSPKAPGCIETVTAPSVVFPYVVFVYRGHSRRAPTHISQHKGGEEAAVGFNAVALTLRCRPFL